jgi:hypothetical protein
MTGIIIACHELQFIIRRFLRTQTRKRNEFLISAYWKLVPEVYALGFKPSACVYHTV